MDPKVIECWNKALEEFRLAEKKCSEAKREIVIEHLIASVAFAYATIVAVKDGETDLASGDFFDFGGQIKNKSIHETLLLAKEALQRIHGLVPRDYYLPEP